MNAVSVRPNNTHSLWAPLWFLITGPAVGIILMAMSTGKGGVGWLIILPFAYGLTGVAALIAGLLYSLPFYLVLRFSAFPVIHVLSGAILGAVTGYVGMALYYYTLVQGAVSLFPGKGALSQYYGIGAIAGGICGLTFPLVIAYFSNRKTQNQRISNKK